MKKILITRPQEQAQELVQALEKADFIAFVEPLFLVKKIAVRKNLSAEIAAIVLTSSNACETVIDYGFSKNVKIFVVGKKTAQKLQEAGFVNIKVAPQNSALSLKNLIVETQEKNAGLILYFHGLIVTLDFKFELEKSGFAVEKILCYETAEMANFSQNLLGFAAQNSFDQVTIFSQNSAEIFFKLAKKHNLLEYFKGSQILCLSQNIVSRLKKFGFSNSTTFAEFPILKKFYD